VRIDDIEEVAIVHQLLRAHQYWRMKQLAVDLVILNERASSYIQDLQIALETLVRTSRSPPQTGADVARGSVFVLRTDLISAETRARLLSVARAVLSGRHGTLSEQLNRLPDADTAGAPTESAPRRRLPSADLPPQTVPVPPNLEFFNGLGGFTAGGPYRPRGSMSSPIPRSAFRSRSRAAATPGRAAAVRTSSLPGRTTPSPIVRARSSIYATKSPVSCGARRPCRSVTRPRPISPGMARATAGSSTPRTGSLWISCNTCRSTTRSRSHA
jgi:hypothetical protein